MSEDPLQQLYQDILLDHNKQPRRYGLLEHPTHRAEGYNPLCGDRMELTLQVVGERIEAAGFEAAACAICKASASIMADALPGKTLQEASELDARVHQLLDAADSSDLGSDGDFVALSGVSRFPARVKCATLPWHTFNLALKKDSDAPGPSGDAPDK